MKIAIIGAGASGLMAAASIRHDGNALITIFERNDKAGKKIYITGKGRCNFTNFCEPSEFLQSVPTNPRFLYSAIYSFTPKDAVEFFEKNGLKTKIERGNRAFPLSDKASDITKTLINAAALNGAKIRLNCGIKAISKLSDGFLLTLDDGSTELYDKVIIATGGKSYPSTGSTGDGYRFAAAFAHTIITPKPSLVSIVLAEDVSAIEGLSLKNVEVTLKLGKKSRREFGEMLFTRKGVSGPIILSLSSHFAKEDISGAKLSINLKPALDSDALDKRILRDFSEFTNKQLKNSLDKLLPKSLISFIIDYAGLDGTKPTNLITKLERQRLLDALISLEFTILGVGGFEEAIITSGGVSTKEINPSTMESKILDGLYFIGEVLDVDALTGGFNMQIALSTAFLSAKAITSHFC